MTAELGLLFAFEATDYIVVCVALMKVTLVGAASDSYAPHLTAGLHSALTRIDRRRDVRVFVLDGGLAPRSRARIRRCLAGAHPRATVEILSPDTRSLADLPTDPRYPVAVYLQLLAPQLLPEDVELALYIDSDVVVTEDVAQLFDGKRAPRALWAVRDGEIDVNLPRLKRGFPDVGFREGAEYINTGVLLMNLPLWRSERIADRTIDVLRNNRELCVWKNQDAINVTLAGDWGLLPDKWNNRLRGYTWAFPKLERPEDGEGILHFCGHRKPWRGWCLKDQMYFDALVASGWPSPLQRLAIRLNRPYRSARLAWQIWRRKLSLGGRLRQLARFAPARTDART